VNDQPPGDVVGRLRPIPTYRDHPATTAHDVEGLAPDGSPRTVAVIGSTEPILLLFLSSDCLGCLDLWEGMAPLRAALPDGMRIIVLTRGVDREDAAAVASLARPGTEVVMSSEAYADYRVGGPPFLVVIASGGVRTEGVAWGIEETARASRVALAG
jgi:hypothetical protein